jgi:hypothetical protein
VAEVTRDEERKARAEFVQGLEALTELFRKDGRNRLPLPKYGLTVQLDADVQVPSDKPGAMPWDTVVDQEASLSLLKRIVSGMGRGRKEKRYLESSFSCVKELGGNVTLRVDAGRNVICTPRKTGRIVVHPAHVYTAPERVEEEVEWVCDETLLGGKPAEAVEA